MNTRIAIADGPGSPARRITKIVTYRQGGFAVLAPYHSARRGYLAKYTVDYSESVSFPVRSEMQEYSASDRVKLSLHPDGFVQFSGEDPSRIISGRDAATGEPRGLGLMLERPLSQPILSGPTFAIVVWGLGGFVEETDPRGAVVFERSDCYLRSQPDIANGYLVEGFLFPRRYLMVAREVRGRLRLSLACLLFGATAGVLDFVVLPLPEPALLLGLVASRLKTSFSAESGFCLNSPSDRRAGNRFANTLVATYPEIPNPPMTTLDHRPNVDAG
jgi:hypothetical protein